MYAVIDKCNEHQLKNVISEITKHWTVTRLELDALNHSLLDSIFNYGGQMSYEFRIRGELNERLLNKLRFYSDVFDFKIIIDFDKETDVKLLGLCRNLKTVLRFNLNQEILDRLKALEKPEDFIYRYQLDYDNIDESLIRDFIAFATEYLLLLEVEREVPSCLLSDELYFDLTVFNKETEGNNLMNYILVDENLDYRLAGHDKVLGTILNKRIEQIVSHIELEYTDLIFSPVSKTCYTCKYFLSKGYRNCYLRR